MNFRQEQENLVIFRPLFCVRTGRGFAEKSTALELSHHLRQLELKNYEDNNVVDNKTKISNSITFIWKCKHRYSFVLTISSECYTSVT